MKTKIVFCTTVLLLSAFTGSVFGGTEGNINTFYGTGAGTNTIGDNDYDTFIGAGAGYSNTTGYYNTFIGHEAGTANTTGYWNTFLGADAGTANTTGYENTFLGLNAGGSNTTGNYNTFAGRSAGNHNTTGAQNTFLGYTAGASNTTAGYNTFVGYGAGYLNTTGWDNTFIGYEAGYANTTGHWNTFLGWQAGTANTTGSGNTFVGLDAGYSNTTSSNNTYVGYGAGNLTTGSGNIFLGYQAGANETGSNRLYIDNSITATPLIYGEFDTRNLTIYGNLEVIGPDNGLVYLSNTTADNTVKVSRMVLSHYSNAADPVYLFGAASTATDNFVAFGGGNTIGNAATRIDLFTAENTTTPVGMARITVKGNGYVGIGIDPLYPLEMHSGAYVTTGGVWTNASSREYKENIEALASEEALDTLKELNPVKFVYKKDMSERHVGFIAEDVPDLVSTKDRKGLSPMDIVAVLTKVVQKLKVENETLKADNGSLKADISSLAQRLTALEGKGIGCK